MNPYLLLVSVATVVSAACAGCIFARDPERRPNQLAALLLLGGAFWGLCELRWNLAPTAELARWWVKLSAPGWMFVGPLVLHLFLAAAPGSPSPLRRLLLPAYAGCAALMLLCWSTPWFVGEAHRETWGWGWELGPGMQVLYAVTMACIGAAAVLARRTFRGTLSPAERRQVPWVVLALAGLVGIASVTDVFLPLLGIQIPRLGTTAFAFLGGVAVWTLLHFGYAFLAPGSFADEMLAALPDGVALLHSDARIRSANQGLARLSGHPRTRLIGMPVGELIEPRQPPLPEETDGIEAELLHASGERIAVSVSASTLLDRQGYPLGRLLVARDLREVEELRSRLITSGRLAAVGELAAGIAHEINNPIAYVRSNLSQLETHWKTLRSELGQAAVLRDWVGEGEDLIQESIEGVDRAAQIVRGVRGFTHAGSGAREVANLNRLLEDVLQMAVPQLRGRVVVVREYSDIPAVHCAPQELKQVFLNLIVNAGHAVDDGGTIRLRTGRDGATVTVAVEDDGCGIPPDVLGRIFDPFFTTKPVGEGTGLGLGIAYQIVTSHGGGIEVDSTPSRGSCFRVHLPIDRRSP